MSKWIDGLYISLTKYSRHRMVLNFSLVYKKFSTANALLLTTLSFNRRRASSFQIATHSSLVYISIMKPYKVWMIPHFLQFHVKKSFQHCHLRRNICLWTMGNVELITGEFLSLFANFSRRVWRSSIDGLVCVVYNLEKYAIILSCKFQEHVSGLYFFVLLPFSVPRSIIVLFPKNLFMRINAYTNIYFCIKLFDWDFNFLRRKDVDSFIWFMDLC